MSSLQETDCTEEETSLERIMTQAFTGYASKNVQLANRRNEYLPHICQKPNR